MSPSASLEAEASNCTSVPAVGVLGDTLNVAVGAVLASVSSPPPPESHPAVAKNSGKATTSGRRYRSIVYMAGA